MLPGNTIGFYAGFSFGRQREKSNTFAVIQSKDATATRLVQEHAKSIEALKATTTVLEGTATAHAPLVDALKAVIPPVETAIDTVKTIAPPLETAKALLSMVPVTVTMPAASMTPTPPEFVTPVVSSTPTVNGTPPRPIPIPTPTSP
jgi:cytoskeletal protein RodZ